MDSKIKILFILSISPILLLAQSRATQKYIDSSELQLKLYAAQRFYVET